MRIKLLLLSSVLLLLATSMLWAQGVTTSTLKGKITDGDGNVLSGATVVALHVPSGTQYGTVSMADGRYLIQGMRVGGPYKVMASFVGYKNGEQSEVMLTLNNTGDINLSLVSMDKALDEVIVKFDKNTTINSERMGSTTFISKADMANMPTIARSQQDFTRLTPQANGNSFGGRNVLYNNFSLDGSIFNNSFGLDYATPGGQSDAQPVSLDAIDQMQVSLAPFDVREGGFTGAGVNAVTKSGTNTFYATVYHYFRNDALIGKKIEGQEVRNLDYSTTQSGLSVGGPIIKNKLFFFVNAEAERRNQLAHGFIANNNDGKQDPGETSVMESDIIAVQNHLKNVWNYDPGAYQGYFHETYNNKFLAKIDYNISNNHQLALRYNYLDAWKDILPHPEAVIGRGPTTFRLPFENSSYRIFNKINSFVAELNSRFGSKYSNKMLVGYTTFRDHREPHSVPYPVIDIFIGGNLAITAASEMFSTSNVLNQDVFQFTNNFSYYMNKHTLTAGVNYEQFSFENSFNLFYYPWVAGFSVNDFVTDNLWNMLANVPTNRSDVMAAQMAAQNAAKFAWSYVKVGQLGVYVQDEFQPTDNLNLTLGLRVDVPIYLNEIKDNVSSVTNFNGWKDENGNTVKIDPSKWPTANPLWAPRFGFNWNVLGNKTLQVRGGSGVFSGRVPFVWLGNQSSNARLDSIYEFQVNATTEDFKFPQAWKTDLAIDHNLGAGWIVSVEGIYSKDINAVVHRNYNMAAPSAQLSGSDDRAIFAGFNEVNIYSSTPGGVGFLDAGAIVLDNTDKGYQYTLTAQIKKEFSFNLHLSAAYTYMESKDLTSIPAEIAADAFQRNPIVGNPNEPMFANSRYGLNHRIIGTAMYQLQSKIGTTSFAAFFELGKGNRYSYTYAGDLNRDAISNNDLLYVPASQSEINFGTVDATGTGIQAANAAEQWAALNAFIEQDDYLSTRRGDYAERHGATLPWFSTVDVRLAHDIVLQFGETKNTLRLSLDILNFGNMLNSDWGVRKLATTYNPIAVNGIDNNNVPYFTFNTNLKDSYTTDFSVASKWQMQFGIRYIFN